MSSIISERCSSIIDQVPDCHNWMMEDHPWAGVAHDLFDSLTHLGFITVNCAILAGWLISSEGTFLEAFFRVFPKVGTFLAKLSRIVLPKAVQVDHRLYCFSFLGYINHTTSKNH